MFEDRVDAGVKLAERLAFLKNEDTIVLGIPRGGLVVANEVAKVIDAPLDIVVPRKVGAPHNPEVAVGAVTEDGTVLWHEDLMNYLGLEPEDMEDLVSKEIEEIERRTNVYRGDRERAEFEGKNVVLIDDGIATGFTVMAAVRSLQKSNPNKLILAVPVGPEDTLEAFKNEVDEVVCLEVPEDFRAVGQFYRDFGQTSDEEVIEILGRNKRVN